MVIKSCLIHQHPQDFLPPTEPNDWLQIWRVSLVSLIVPTCPTCRCSFLMTACGCGAIRMVAALWALQWRECWVFSVFLLGVLLLPNQWYTLRIPHFLWNFQSFLRVLTLFHLKGTLSPFLMMRSSAHGRSRPLTFTCSTNGPPSWIFPEWKCLAMTLSWRCWLGRFLVASHWPKRRSSWVTAATELMNCQTSLYSFIIWMSVGHPVWWVDQFYFPSYLPFLQSSSWPWNLPSQMQNGLEVFTNSLHINDFRNAWWKSPSTVDISCVSRCI